MEPQSPNMSKDGLARILLAIYNDRSRATVVHVTVVSLVLLARPDTFEGELQGMCGTRRIPSAAQ
jgi:hypothetical protein